MKPLSLIFCSILLLAFGASAVAADLNGKWKGDLKTPDGNSLEINMVFKVDGEKLTGTVTNTYGEEQITEGTVKGDDISFIILAGGGQFKLVYKAKVDGDQLKFTVTIGDMGDAQMVAKRVP
jgi:sRNA-binding regulator protein Hfq